MDMIDEITVCMKSSHRITSGIVFLIAIFQKFIIPPGIQSGTFGVTQTRNLRRHQDAKLRTREKLMV